MSVSQVPYVISKDHSCSITCVDLEELRASVDAIHNTASSVSTGKSCVLVSMLFTILLVLCRPTTEPESPRVAINHVASKEQTWI
jgi:hypothetical protein